MSFNVSHVVTISFLLQVIIKCIHRLFYMPAYIKFLLWYLQKMISLIGLLQSFEIAQLIKIAIQHNDDFIMEFIRGVSPWFTFRSVWLFITHTHTDFWQVLWALDFKSSRKCPSLFTNTNLFKPSLAIKFPQHPYTFF